MSKYKNYEKTKDMIRETFAKLVIEKKEFDAISIKDIIEGAGIAKSTFYYHYDDIDDFLIELYTDIIAKFNKLVSGYYQQDVNAKFLYVRQTAKFLKQYDDFFRVLLKSDKSNAFIKMFKNNLVEVFQKDNTLKLHQISANRRTAEIHMVANGISYLFVDYYRENLNVTLDEIADLVCSSISFSNLESLK